MKRIYLLLITLIVFGQTISAQNDRKLLKMTFGESYFELKYDEKGRLIESVEYIADDHLKRSSKYAYSNDNVVQTDYENEDIKNKDIRTTVLQNNRVVSERIHLSAHEGEPEYWADYNYTYNGAGELIKVVTTSNGRPDTEYKLTWTDGDITLVEHFRDNKKVGQVAYEYNKNITNKYLSLIVNPITSIADYEGISPHGQLLAGYFGKVFQHPVAAVHYTVIDKHYFGWSSDDDFTITYNQNASGIVENIKQSGGEGATATLIWEETPTGISVYKQEKENTKTIYDLSGKRLENMQHGVNIIKETNGKTHKVIVR
ncbi:DUF4595 domain-containing protein [Prevotella melaninogenica]|uniref:DUF4595 domain-containing protein n=1 Tax=Prevotella melaninogenica TaxID=28132 RepID=UPI001C5EC8A7|nr:DUF4595 domain-containing protein [Prevotella melaninogenica]MBW4740677.1 DUF4595 domain-containing protein [Prevotella melaninogenica]MBW4911371.1 DUF4595 domain-containing protein [Prevotella melaninogenica]